MKRNPNSIPAFLLALVLAVSLVLPVGAAGSGITLDKTSATLAVGQTLTLTATLPEGSQDAAITWASANEAIAALVPPAQGQPANTAVFRGMTAGTVTVTATAGGRTALCTITVAQDTPASVTITPAGPEFLPVGKTRQLTAQVNYTLGSAGNQNVVWSSSDPQVATVDRNGKVTAVAEGTATILAVSEAKDAQGSPVGTDPTLQVTPTADTTYTCTVTAACTLDSTQVLTGQCVYTLRMHPGTTLGAVTGLAQGTRTLDQLKNQSGTLSLIDQLVQGDSASESTPAVPGLRSVVFALDSVTGTQVGTLSVQEGTYYYLEGEAGQALLSQVTFTPRQAGTYGINFRAYGDALYCGRLEILVQETDVPPAEGDKVCDATGFPFTGDDFYHSDAEDPVIAVVFGQPSAGRLLRDVRHGAGTPDDGARYYTNAASDGTYHVSTLHYLPPAGFSGQVTIPMTLLTQQGQEWEDILTVAVTSKTHSHQFTDVNEATVGTWAANAVDFAYHFGLVNGTGEDTFSPSSNMTRAQLVTVLYRAVGSPTMTITTNFEDLDVGAYYYSAVVWANFHGIVNGTSDTTFSPNDFITREQLAAILHRYARAYGGDLSHTGDLSAFTDQNLVSEYAREAMTWAVDKGILTGVGSSTLAPQGNATRAQVVVMLHRYLAE